jgi:hypothetical protein
VRKRERPGAEQAANEEQEGQQTRKITHFAAAFQPRSQGPVETLVLRALLMMMHDIPPAQGPGASQAAKAEISISRQKEKPKKVNKKL